MYDQLLQTREREVSEYKSTVSVSVSTNEWVQWVSEWVMWLSEWRWAEVSEWDLMQVWWCERVSRNQRRSHVDSLITDFDLLSAEFPNPTILPPPPQSTMTTSTGSIPSCVRDKISYLECTQMQNRYKKDWLWTVCVNWLWSPSQNCSTMSIVTLLCPQCSYQLVGVSSSLSLSLHSPPPPPPCDDDGADT